MSLRGWMRPALVALAACASACMLPVEGLPSDGSTGMDAETPGPDASMRDAGDLTVDAGPGMDAGRGDAGELVGDDGGRSDAGRVDAGRMDAGRVDAGRVDAGRPDAGRPDAGRPDAGRPDAGRPDAGRPDAGPPRTCMEIFGGLPGFTAVCAMTTTACIFAIDPPGDGPNSRCDRICMDAGATCISRRSETGMGCTGYGSSALNCATQRDDPVCECTRPP